MNISMESPSAFRVAREFQVSAATLIPKVHAVLHTFGHLLATKAKANASTGFHPPGAPHIPGTGPGPNVATGDYLRSINAEFFTGPMGGSAVVGTNAVQARRLEFGFSGTDSLGRHYNQPPYPHFGPAADFIEPRFVEALEAVAVL